MSAFWDSEALAYTPLGGMPLTELSAWGAKWGVVSGFLWGSQFELQRWACEPQSPSWKGPKQVWGVDGPQVSVSGGASGAQPGLP